MADERFSELNRLFASLFIGESDCFPVSLPVPQAKLSRFIRFANFHCQLGRECRANGRADQVVKRSQAYTRLIPGCRVQQREVFPVRVMIANHVVEEHALEELEKIPGRYG